MKTKHTKIKERLLDMIKGLPQDTKIPSERELVNYVDGSRMTVRKAIDDLVQERVLYRIYGSGTYVAKKGHRKYLNNLLGFSAEVIQQGGFPSHKLILLKQMLADEELAKSMEIAPKDKVYYVVRINEKNGEPMLLDYAYFNAKITGNITKKIATGSLYKYFEEKLGLKIATAVQEFSAEIVNQEVSKLLNIAPGTPIIKVTHTTFLDNGSVLEHTVGYRHPTKYHQMTIAYK